MMRQIVRSGDDAQDAENCLADWFNRVVDATSAAQPSSVAPLNAVTSLLKEFVQYSEAFQTLPNGAQATVYDGGTPGPGLHLIPTEYGVRAILSQRKHLDSISYGSSIVTGANFRAEGESEAEKCDSSYE
jgi:hypothetical protein